jgi:hypothetical protein
MELFAAGEVFMYESPPPYGGIGPDHAPYPAGAAGDYRQATAPPNYNDAMQAPPLPTKA